MDEWLGDPEAPWWAKLRRAAVHIGEVRQLAAGLDRDGAWSVERNEAGADGWEYRLRIHRDAPADLRAVVGDAVANMRSALDHVAYELARHRAARLGKELGDEEEAATSFPICVNEAAFRRFFACSYKGKIRGTLYGDAERKAFRCVQPFALTAEAHELGVNVSADPQEDLLTDHAYVLNAVWNIDKHRRLPRLAWAVDDLVWFVDAVPTYRWTRRFERFAPLGDGAVLGELYDPGNGRPQAGPNFGVELVLADDPSPYPSPLVPRLERLHQSIAGWVVPRMFFVARGNPPPIMISFSPPP